MLPFFFAIVVVMDNWQLTTFNFKIAVYIGPSRVITTSCQVDVKELCAIHKPSGLNVNFNGYKYGVQSGSPQIRTKKLLFTASNLMLFVGEEFPLSSLVAQASDIGFVCPEYTTRSDATKSSTLRLVMSDKVVRGAEHLSLTLKEWEVVGFEHASKISSILKSWSTRNQQDF